MTENIIAESVYMYRGQSVVTITRPHKVIDAGSVVHLESGKRLSVVSIPLYNNPESLPAGKVDIILDAEIRKNDVLYY
ncbi:hypothetical protein [Lactiplantibacillus herbarum]|uniref:hypothetical protein n=1 Tax=Lactiplantibacillus herbarum TaxID=1670446 RepID=UPI00064E4BEE|nr:hypothetical protein [Lactiplantibacillus herbarum]